MDDHKSGKLSDEELLGVSGGIDSGVPSPLYNIGAVVCNRNETTCFGSVIKRYLKNGGWMYRVMGSDTNPKDIAEIDARLKLIIAILVLT